MILLCIGLLSFTSVIRLYRPSTVLRYGLPFWLPYSITRFYQLTTVRVSITLSHFGCLIPQNYISLRQFEYPLRPFWLSPSIGLRTDLYPFQKFPSPASFHHLPPKYITERKDLAMLTAPRSTFQGCQESPNDSALPTLSSPLSESAQIPADDPAIPWASESRAGLYSRRTMIYVQDWTCQRWLDPPLVTALRLFSASSSELRFLEDQQFEKPLPIGNQSSSLACLPSYSSTTASSYLVFLEECHI